MTIQIELPAPLASRSGARMRAPKSALLFGSHALSGNPIAFARGAEIYGEGEPVDYVYKIVKGAVRTYKMLNDGRRQIGAFYLPGDVFGLDAGEDHDFSAEAIVDSSIVVIRRSSVLSLAACDGDVASELLAFTARELTRTRNHVIMLVKTAQERVAAFLLDMAERLAADHVELPMSRQDIADYLGLTIETVSRTLTGLEKSATIALPASRLIVLRDRAALAELNS